MDPVPPQQEQVPPVEPSSGDLVVNRANAADLTGSPVESVRTYTRAEVAKHATPEDCWIIIGARVFDVSGMDDKHPGGAAVYSAAGGDAGPMMMSIGGGKGHSAEAMKWADSLCIGVLAEGE
jgi:nitrate reductase (NAD(P)H)